MQLLQRKEKQKNDSKRIDREFVIWQYCQEDVEGYRKMRERVVTKLNNFRLNVMIPVVLASIKVHTGNKFVEREINKFLAIWDKEKEAGDHTSMPIQISMSNSISQRQEDIYKKSRNITSLEILWELYKLMLICDLLSILEILYFDSRAVIEYVERYYRAIHWCNDKPTEFVTRIIRESISREKKSKIKELLEIVISLHWQIKQQSISVLHLEHTSAIKKYKRIEIIMKQIHMYIFRENLKFLDFNPVVKNFQNECLRMCYDSSIEFKMMMVDLSLILECQEALRRKKIEEGMSIKGSIDIIKEVPENQNIIEYESQELLFKELRRKIDEEGKLYSELKKLLEILEETRFNKLNEDIFEVLELLKFNVIKYAFMNIRIKREHIGIYYLLTQISLFKTAHLKTIWERFGENLSQIQEMVNEAKVRIKVQQFVMHSFRLLCNDSKSYEEKFECVDHATKEKMIEVMKKIDIDQFGYSELLIVGFICGNWQRVSGVNQNNKTIIIGKTRVGKSSLLRFSTKDQSIKIGNSLESETFYPRKVLLKKQLQYEGFAQFWDLPGLEDNRERIFKLCTGYFLRVLSQKCPIKIIYMISSFANFYQNIENYVELIYLLGEILQWKSEGLESVNFIFSYIKGRKKAEMKQYEKQHNKLEKYSEEIIEQKLNEMNASLKNFKLFHNKLLERLKKGNIEFFYKNDVTPTEELEIDSDVSDKEQELEKEEKRKKQSREALIRKMTENPEKHIEISVHPLAYIREEEAFFDQFDSYDRIKQYLRLQSRQNSELMLKFFSCIRYFKTISEEEVREQFDTVHRDLQIQYREIQESFYILNSMTGDKESIKEKIVNIFYKNLNIFFENKLDQDHKVYACLLKYVTKLTQLKYAILDLREVGEIQELEEILIGKTTFKYPEIFGKNISFGQKLNEFYSLISEREIEYNLIKLIEEETLRNEYNQDSLLLIEHLLILMSRENYERIKMLHRKYRELQSERINSEPTSFLRINFYGEGVYQKLIISEFLKFNAFIVEGKEKKYVLSESENIKIFCEELVIDLQVINIECKESLYIVSKRILFTVNECALKVDNISGKPASVIIKCTEDFESKRLIFHNKAIPEDFKILSEEFEGNLIQNSSMKKENRTKKNDLIRKIKMEGKIVSRTSTISTSSNMINVEYLEKVVYEPPISFIQKPLMNDNSKRINIIYRVISSQKKLEFGALHLAYLVIKQLPAEFKSIESVEDQIQQISQKVIQYIMEKFKRTSLRIHERHFSTLYCKNLAIIIRDYIISTKKLEKLEPLLNSCFRALKRQLFALLFRNIMKKVQQDLTKRFGKSYAARKIQDEIAVIKIYCENLLRLPYQVMFESENSEINHEIRRISKIINFKFKNLLFSSVSNQIEIRRLFSSLFWKMYQLGESESEKLIQSKQEDFMEVLLKGLDDEWTNSLRDKDLIEKYYFQCNREEKSVTSEKNLNKQSLFEPIITFTEEFLSTNQARQRIIKLFQKKQYSTALRQYLNKKYLFQRKQDIVHEYLAYVYLKLLNFEKAKKHFMLIPDETHLKFTTLFNVLNAKYNTIFKRSSIQSSQIVINEKSIMRQTRKYLKIRDYEDPLTYNNFKSKLYEKSNMLDYNILSFDDIGNNINNNNKIKTINSSIINVIFAAKIEKVTHRPIMHMFDMVCGKTTSSFLAGALVVPRNDNQYEFDNLQIVPEFMAYQIIENYSQVIKKLNGNSKLKERFKEHNFRDLKTHLSIVNNIKNSEEVISYFNLEKQEQEMTIFKAIASSITSRKFHNENSDPLCSSLEILDLRNRNVNILSLGCGQVGQPVITGFKERPDYIKNNYKYERWQVQLDEALELESQSQQYFVQHARIFIEEKWISETKSMRELFDKLEDRPIFKNLQMGLV